MNNAQYLENRLKSLISLCDKFACDGEAAIKRYCADVDALDKSADESPESIPFRQIVADFSLSTFEANALFLSIAPTLDASFRPTLARMRQNFALSQIAV